MKFPNKCRVENLMTCTKLNALEDKSFSSSLRDEPIHREGSSNVNYIFEV